MKDVSGLQHRTRRTVNGADADSRRDPRSGLVCRFILACICLIEERRGTEERGRDWADYADTSYDASSAVGLVRAAERAKSPAILQLFPISLEYGGVAYLRFCVDL
jgi:hypothetical protein